MIKYKIYLDTSAISHLEQPERPSEQAYTRDMFSFIKDGKFDVYLSRVVFNEIDACPPVKRAILWEHISEIDFKEIMIDDNVKALATKIIDQQVLPQKSIPDSQHIAAAIVAGCDYIVSWNMKHMANVRVNKGVRIITITEGHKEVMLIPPSMLLDGRNFDEENN